MVQNGLAVGAMSYAFMRCLGAFLAHFPLQRLGELQIRYRRESETILSAVAEERSRNPTEEIQPKTPTLEFP